MLKQIFLMEADIIVAIAHHDAEDKAATHQYSWEVAILLLVGEGGILLLAREEDVVEVHIDCHAFLQLAGCQKAFQQKLIHPLGKVEMKLTASLAGVGDILYSKRTKTVADYIRTWNSSVWSSYFRAEAGVEILKHISSAQVIAK